MKDHIEYCDCYPVSKQDGLEFFREEQNGMFTIMLKKHMELGYIKINKMTKFILDKCTGQNNINQLIDVILDSFQVSDHVDLRNDVDMCLNSCWRLGLITFAGPNYLLSKYQKESSGILIRYLQEDDAVRFFNDTSRIDTIMNPYMSFEEEYNPSLIPIKWMSGTESFFEIYKDDTLLGKISIKPDKILNAYIISSIIYQNRENVSSVIADVLNFIHNTYKDVLDYDVTGKENILFIIYYDNVSDFSDFGFHYSGELRSEIGEQSVYVYQRYMD